MAKLDIQVSEAESEQNCPFCQATLAIDEPTVRCVRCKAEQHEECWSEHGKCSSCGALSFEGEAAELVELTVVPRQRARSISDMHPLEIIFIACLLALIFGPTIYFTLFPD